ncbi:MULTISPECIES: GOLPH3/VPS74 family protein [Nocardiopsidaceae]|uniref:GPP34 family phosphoprotein n=1 Tax=Streptomonospora nanhaiensis TaxID=1323731 RepID=A0ABY6YFS6_9ACTN|nr:GPP34 family phosphoprotein [Streptomonospora nanhaiensis]WAE71113.1 GPP34 family phosphoprotein [Streptomonospora nanhaiensis]
MEPTLPQRLYLLSYDTDKNRFDPVSTAYRGHLLRAAALTELILGGLLRARDGRAERDTARTPEDPFLAEVLDGLSPHEPGHWINAVPDREWKAERAVREQLVANGSITVDRGRVLGLFPTLDVTLEHPGEVRRLRERVHEAVRTEHTVATAPAEDVALAAIAADGDVWTVFTPQERHEYRAGFKAVHERFGVEVPGMRTAILAAVVNRRAGTA